MLGHVEFAGYLFEILVSMHTISYRIVLNYHNKRRLLKGVCDS